MCLWICLHFAVLRAQGNVRLGAPQSVDDGNGVFATLVNVVTMVFPSVGATVAVG